MSSSGTNPKPSGYPASAATSASANGGAPPSSNANGNGGGTAYPYYANPNPNPNYYPQNPNPNPNYYPQNPNPNPNPNYYPQNPNPNPYYYPPNPNSNALVRPTFFRRLFAVFAAAFILLGAITLIIYLILRPKIPAVTLTSLSVSSFNLSSDSLSARFDLNLTIDNPNSKMSAYYERLGAAVYFGGERLADTSLAPLFQPKHDSTTLKAQMAAESEFIGGDDANSIRSGMGNGDHNVEFEVLVAAAVRFRSGLWRTRRHLMRAECRDVEVVIKNRSGEMKNGPIRCWISM